MARVSIDGQITSFESISETTDIIKSVIAQLPADRVIQEVLLDGNRMQSTRANFTHAINEIEIRTSPAAFWASNGIELALNNLERIQKTLLRTAVCLREDRIKEAVKLLQHCLEGLDRMVETLSITRRAVKTDFARIVMDGKDLASLEQDLILLQQRIGNSWESDQLEPLAERIEYELLPHLSHWARLLRNLNQRLNENF